MTALAAFTPAALLARMRSARDHRTGPTAFTPAVLLARMRSARALGAPVRTRVVLVSCSKVKSDHGREVPAEHLYAASSLFRAQLAYARTLVPDAQIRILSAKHEALKLDHWIDTYDFTMKDVFDPDQWGAKVVRQLASDFEGPLELVLLAGDDYARPIARRLSPGWSMKLPLDKLEIGQRGRWLKARRGAGPLPKPRDPPPRRPPSADRFTFDELRHIEKVCDAVTYIAGRALRARIAHVIDQRDRTDASVEFSLDELRQIEKVCDAVPHISGEKLRARVAEVLDLNEGYESPGEGVRVTYRVLNGLSVQHPWAAGLVDGIRLDGRLYHKTVELRTWMPPASALAKRIAICATQSVNEDAMQHFGLRRDDCQLGQAIGFATLVGYHEATVADGPGALLEISESMLAEQRATGRPWIAWVFADPRPNPAPFKVSGAPGRLLNLASLGVQEEFDFHDARPLPPMPVDRLFRGFAAAAKGDANAERELRWVTMFLGAFGKRANEEDATQLYRLTRRLHRTHPPAATLAANAAQALRLQASKAPSRGGLLLQAAAELDAGKHRPHGAHPSATKRAG